MPARARGPGRFKPAVSTRLEDATADRVRRNVDSQIRQLQSLPIAQGRLFKGIELPDAQLVTIPHGFGRRAFVLVSPPYTTFGATGRISQSLDVNTDPAQFATLRAFGWTATITVDVYVF